jgi:hypothetical protein
MRDGLNSPGLGYAQVVSSCKHSNELLVSFLKIWWDCQSGKVLASQERLDVMELVTNMLLSNGLETWGMVCFVFL